MEIYCSSSFIKECGNIYALLDNYKEYKNNIIYILDTNLCILYRDFYYAPLSFKTKRPECYSAIKELHSLLSPYHSNIIYALAIEESSRTVSNFTMNQQKQREITSAIQQIFQMNTYQFERFALTVKKVNIVKDYSPKGNSKINALKQDIPFIPYIRVIYVCLLKLYLLKRLNKGKIYKYIDFLAFIDEKVDMVLSQVLTFAIFYIFDECGSLKKIMDKKENSLSELIHNIWNASIDMYFITFTRMLISSNELPVLITADKNLHKLNDMIIYRKFSLDENNKVSPQIHEMGVYGRINFLSKSELDEILQLNNDFNRKRRHKNHTRDPFDNSILDLCAYLEDELKLSYNKVMG
ncbi:hypothetical protein [Sporomusa malonica]|uniref:PIN domain-containing protein n=1 Tax=Sporomusa malonica TaxID=112901 RepID=A0A1W2D5Z4_9FIRM|nr:hypothetical protein [Sporomusa malonica]SMC92512.1 hypothetical protein SAMN04488500_113124 [Sporomusa malonica]